jgi:hypothetical protein
MFLGTGRSRAHFCAGLFAKTNVVFYALDLRLPKALTLSWKTGELSAGAQVALDAQHLVPLHHSLAADE